MSFKYQAMLPQRALSKLAGILANCSVPIIKNFLIRYFLNKYPTVDMSEAIQPDYRDYANFNAFFGRQLRPELRPITNGLYDIASPADGMTVAQGKIGNGTKIIAKGHNFTVNTLINNSQHSFQKFATIYLAPYNYHRVHLPVDAQITRMTYIPGRLFSVNPAVLDAMPNILADNERVVIWLEGGFGEMAIVMVGAMLVSSIVISWIGNLHNNGQIQHFTYQEPIRLKRGEELARFNLGSTVIMLLQDNAELALTEEVRYGQKIGTLSSINM